jgi:hypothetical protein
MRKGTLPIVMGSVLLFPSAVALALTALTGTAVGRQLFVRGWIFLGLNGFLIYWDPVVVLVIGRLGLTLVLVGLRSRRIHKTHV